MAINIGRGWKDADDTKKFTVNWSRYLSSGATIVSGSSPDVPAGITVPVVTNDDTTTTHTTSGGKRGQAYTITARVSTSDGEQLDLEFTIEVI